MLTLYHAPRSRSTRIVRLIDELGIWNEVDIRTVIVPRNDGSGGRDPRNPHPEGKVPYLVHDGVGIWESNAIILYLTDMFPGAGMGPRSRRPAARALPELAGVVRQRAGTGHDLRLRRAVASDPRRNVPGHARSHGAPCRGAGGGPFLMGETFTAADLLVVSAFTWAPDTAPDNAVIRAWIDRCEARPSARKASEFDEARLEGAASG